MSSSSSFTEIFLNYICPSLGCMMSNIMFAAPVMDLRAALLKGSFGPLNPFPWSIQLGNCLGWIVYAYYTRDPFVLAANWPGLIVSIWLNMGAAKLQYTHLQQQQVKDKQRQDTTVAGGGVETTRTDQMRRRRGSHSSTTSTESALQRRAAEALAAAAASGVTARVDGLDAAATATTNNDDDVVLEGENWSQMARDSIDDQAFVLVDQERQLMRVLVVWSVVIIYVGWLEGSGTNPATLIGWVVNLNLIFFYGAPLQAIRIVVQTKCSDVIHTPTMMMNWINTTFWILYGLFGRHDFVIVIPNACGLSLGIAQGILCFLYPKSNTSTSSSTAAPLLAAALQEDVVATAGGGGEEDESLRII